MGLRVCKDAFATLYGVGRHPRLASLLKSVMSGDQGAPLDLRFVKRVQRATPSPKRGEAWSFLHSLWESVAETLPEDSLNLAGCTEKVEDGQETKAEVQVLSTWYSDLAPEEPVLELRHLPPGSHREYFRQFKAVAPGPCSLKLFMDVWERDFPRLKIRGKGRHTMCPVCIKHKLLMQKLKNNSQALNRQRALYNRHLAAQYLDRKQYWSARSDSRLQNYMVCIISDNMDQSKFAWPRSENIVDNHNFDKYQRPRLHLNGTLIHGHAVILTLSHNDVSKSGSTTVDLLSYCLTMLNAKSVPLKRCFLHVQLDNTASTNKNNVLFSWMGAITAAGKVAGCQAAFLRVGHTHEDEGTVYFVVLKWKDLAPSAVWRRTWTNFLGTAAGG